MLELEPKLQGAYMQGKARAREGVIAGLYGRVQNNILEMGGHDGQSIPKLIGHLDKLVGH